jgi:nicotinamidase-related amidase
MSVKGSNQRIKGQARRCLETLCTDNADAQAELDKLKPLNEMQDEGEEEEKSGPMLQASETAIVLVQFQNDYMKKNGVMHNFVSESMEESQVLWNTVDLVEGARRKGALVVHTPMSFEVSGTNRSHQFGHMKVLADNKTFVTDSWGAQTVEELAPESDNIVLKGMNTLDAFENTDLDLTLRQKNIVNLAFCGLTSDTSLSATMRHAYELGFNVLCVTDCTAATSKDLQVQCENFAFT